MKLGSYIWGLRKNLLIILSVFILGAFTSCNTVPQYHKHHDHHDQKKHYEVILVTAKIKTVETSTSDHQNIIINDVKVEEGKISDTPDEIFVAIRFGDKMGLQDPIPDLEEGQEIQLQGEYIPADESYPSKNNPGDPVLHFTHHPVGYVIYQGVKYQ